MRVDSFSKCLLLTLKQIPPATVQFNAQMPLQEKAAAVVAAAKKRSSFFRHNVVLLPYGDDFAHQEFAQDAARLSALIAAINSNSSALGATAQWSTFSTYVESVHALNIRYIRITAACSLSNPCCSP